MLQNGSPIRRTGQTTVIETLCAFSLFFACAVSNAATSGLVRIYDDGGVALYLLVSINAEDNVRFQYLATNRSVRCCIHRRGSDFRPVDPNPAAQDTESGEPAKHYKLEQPIEPAVRLPFLGSAVIGKGPIRQLPDASLQLGRRSLGEVVKSCTSQEGVHVTHQALGRSRSSIYLGLGYQVEAPSCAAK